MLGEDVEEEEEDQGTKSHDPTSGSGGDARFSSKASNNTTNKSPESAESLGENTNGNSWKSFDSAITLILANYHNNPDELGAVDDFQQETDALLLRYTQASQIDLLTRAMKIETSRFAGDPRMKLASLLLSRCGKLKGRVGESKESVSMLKAALKCGLDPEYGFDPDSMYIAETFHALGIQHGANGDHNLKVEFVSKAAKIYEKCGHRFDLIGAKKDIANALGSLGDMKQKQIILEEALSSLVDKSDDGGSKPGENNEEDGSSEGEPKAAENDLKARLLCDLSSVLQNPEERRKALEQSVELQKELGQQADPFLLVNTLGSLGVAHAILGNQKQRVQLLQEALELHTKIQRKGDTLQVAILLSNLGNAYRDQGDFKESVRVLGEALRIKEAIYGEAHYELSSTCSNLALSLGRLGEKEKKLQLMQRSFDLAEAQYGSRHSVMAYHSFHLAAALRETGYSEKALPHLEVAMALEEDKATASAASFPTRLLEIIEDMAFCQLDLGRYKEARELFSNGALKIEAMQRQAKLKKWQLEWLAQFHHNIRGAETKAAKAGESADESSTVNK